MTNSDVESPSGDTYVYAFLWCDCIYESAFVTRSLHRTKKGAYKAMRKALLSAYAEWEESRERGESAFGWAERWCVKPIKLEE